MSETVLASLSSEADSGSNNDAPASDAGSAAPDTGSAGAGAEGSRAADSSAAADGTQADDQSGSATGAGAANGKLVPLAALHESREKIRALTAQIDELRKQPQLSAEDAELLKELKAQRKAASEPKEPEFIEDPKGYIDAKAKQTQEALKELREADKQRKDVEQQQRQVQQIIEATLDKEKEFKATTPDYEDALTHLRNIRTRQLKMIYPQATEQQIAQQIGREEITAAAQILQAGGNPAEFAYKYALETMGYVKKAAPAAANGIAAAAAAATAPDKDAVRTLGGGGGGAEAEAESADPMPEFTAALKERFARKRK